MQLSSRNWNKETTKYGRTVLSYPQWHLSNTDQKYSVHSAYIRLWVDFSVISTFWKAELEGLGAQNVESLPLLVVWQLPFLSQNGGIVVALPLKLKIT